MATLKQLILNWLGLADIPARVRDLERPKTFMDVDLGWRNPTQIIVTQKDPNGRDRVEIITLHPGTEFVDVKNTLLDLMRRYGIDPNNTRIDGQPGMQAAIKQDARRRGFKWD